MHWCQLSKNMTAREKGITIHLESQIPAELPYEFQTWASFWEICWTMRLKRRRANLKLKKISLWVWCTGKKSCLSKFETHTQVIQKTQELHIRKEGSWESRDRGWNRCERRWKSMKVLSGNSRQQRTRFLKYVWLYRPLKGEDYKQKGEDRNIDKLLDIAVSDTSYYDGGFFSTFLRKKIEKWKYVSIWLFFFLPYDCYEKWMDI